MKQSWLFSSNARHVIILVSLKSFWTKNTIFFFLQKIHSNIWMHIHDTFFVITGVIFIEWKENRKQRAINPFLWGMVWVLLTSFKCFTFLWNNYMASLRSPAQSLVVSDGVNHIVLMATSWFSSSTEWFFAVQPPSPPSNTLYTRTFSYCMCSLSFFPFFKSIFGFSFILPDSSFQIGHFLCYLWKDIQWSVRDIWTNSEKFHTDTVGSW